MNDKDNRQPVESNAEELADLAERLARLTEVIEELKRETTPPNTQDTLREIARRRGYLPKDDNPDA